MNLAIKNMARQYGTHCSASQPAGAGGSVSTWHGYLAYFSSYITEIISEKCDSELLP